MMLIDAQARDACDQTLVERHRALRAQRHRHFRIRFEAAVRRRANLADALAIETAPVGELIEPVSSSLNVEWYEDDERPALLVGTQLYAVLPPPSSWDEYAQRVVRRLANLNLPGIAKRIAYTHIANDRGHAVRASIPVAERGRKIRDAGAVLHELRGRERAVMDRERLRKRR